MKTKTCGECKYHDKYSCLQQKNIVYISPTHLACIRFCQKNPTNGDRIRQMSNEELAGVIECPHFEGMCIHRDDEYPCKCCKRDWLNAPADCVKQNGNHDTQTDLCKADNTESEGRG